LDRLNQSASRQIFLESVALGTIADN